MKISIFIVQRMDKRGCVCESFATAITFNTPGLRLVCDCDDDDDDDLNLIVSMAF